jgi:hypothetical protein
MIAQAGKPRLKENPQPPQFCYWPAIPGLKHGGMLLIVSKRMDIKMRSQEGRMVDRRKKSQAVDEREPMKMAWRRILSGMEGSENKR